MLTDEDLTSELKLAFEDATDGIAPAAGLIAAVHRRHRAARRRAAALRIAVPAAAACASGVVIAGVGSSPSSDGPRTVVPTAIGTGNSGSRSTVKTVAYLLKVPTDTDSSFGCIDASSAHIVPNTGVWYVAVGNGCTALVVDTDTTLPADARPIELGGVPGIYGTSDESAGVRTIYSQNPDGSWSSLTVSTKASDEALRGFYTPAN
jgi:hypothetical protein